MPESQFPQGNQIAFAEKMLNRFLSLLRQINLAVFKPIEQLVGWQVHQFDFISLFKHRVRHGFPNPYARNLAYIIIEAFQMLHIECRIHINAGIEELFDVLPPLGMPATLGIGVRQFVNQND